jgi:hypothetical protein
LIADGLGVAMIAFSGGNTTTVIAGLGVFVFGGPIVHLAHSNTDGLISLGIRVASIGLFVLGGVLVGNAIFDDSVHNSAEVTVGGVAIIASVAGALTAIVLDASLFAFDIKSVRPRYESAGLAPVIDPKHGSYGLRFHVAF